MFRKQRAYFLSKKSIYVKQQIMSTLTRIDAIPRMFYRQNVSATALTWDKKFHQKHFSHFRLIVEPQCSTWCIIISVSTHETKTCSRKNVIQFISPVMFSVFHFIKNLGLIDMLIFVGVSIKRSTHLLKARHI